MDRRSSITRWVAPAGVASLLLLSACGAERAPEGNVGQASPGATGGSSLIQGRYVAEFPGEEGMEGVRFENDFVADGNRRLRLQTTQYQGQEQGEQYLWIWDGKRLLQVSKSNESEYTLYEAPEEHPDVFDGVRGFLRGSLLDPASEVFAQACPQARRVGTEPIAGRTAVHYRCTPRPEPDGSTGGTANLWLDEATGWLLKDDTVQARQVTVNPRVDDSTFSTEPPAGAKVNVIAARPSAGVRAPDFALPLLKGGRIGLADFAGKPLVLAFFSADVTFDERGEVCPGCRASLIDLQSLTNNGTKPAVLGMLAGGPGKPGYPLVPPGVTLPVAYEEGSEVQQRYGVFGMLGFAFVTSDGKLAATYERALTRTELQKALASLK